MEELRMKKSSRENIKRPPNPSSPRVAIAANTHDKSVMQANQRTTPLKANKFDIGNLRILSAVQQATLLLEYVSLCQYYP
ncbi:hypothetical protein L596_022990 [Steinernema carpocapsae]|uniref:Uncharacterized protein n=1 Tax=Steinernema carpocapsae TaxID=34508 RepID=A0A4U5MD51_STECR|nr:hypothetical protein L596_022990 [Steinernema carpocapsae]